MTTQNPETSLTETLIEPDFTSDLIKAAGYVFIIILVWISFVSIIYPFLIMSFDLFGLLASIVIMVYLISYTFSVVSQFLGVLAYQSASWRYNIPYMNYKKKCPFLRRNLLSYQCWAEQIEKFDVSIFEKCHKEHMWVNCWPERVPSILTTFDSFAPKEQRRLALILGIMGENGIEASLKMNEVLNNETINIDVRLAAGYALAQMKDESGVEPLLRLMGQKDPRKEQAVRSHIIRYGNLAIPYLQTALQGCEDEVKCAGYIELIGKIEDPAGIPILSEFLNDESYEEVTRLQAIYALHSIGTKESFEKLIEYLEIAPEEEKAIIKEVCLSRKLTSFPILIELLANEEISEEYYNEIGDILAQVQAPTYDQFFLKLENPELSQKLASILKEHTPEDEEYQPIHDVLNQYI